jgi:cysteine-rich repeat protein
MGEGCDDGNATSGDGCDANCTATACGNGVATASTGEACDDGNAVEGDGCDSNCSVSACGNGIVAGGEACDDGNTAAGDGCSAACQKELLAVFTFTGAAGSEDSLPADGAAPAPGLASIPVMSRGPGLTPSAAADAFSASAFTTAAALDADDYYTFTVAPDAGFTVSLAQIILDERRSATGIRTWSVRSSLDGFAADLATVAVPDDVLVRTSKIPLGPAFGSLSAPVELRIYGFAAEGSTGTWRLDNVELLGVTAGPSAGAR